METEEPRVGVFVCHCGLNIAGTVDPVAVVEFASTLPDVAYAVDLLFACSDDGQLDIKQAILDHNLNRVVVASCTPRTHEPVFRKVLEEAGLNPYLYDQVNLREHVSWVHMDEKKKATKKAQELVAMSVERAKRLEPLERKSVEVIPKAAVVGAGVAGISAALDLANAGFDTFLIEKRPTIGGQMALLDKVFPQNDCAICILGPIMSEVGRHPKITLLPYSELAEVDGSVGNFHLKVRKKTRYIDPEICNGCGDCEKVCPVLTPNEYEFMLQERKAVYRAFPQSVPNTYTIEKKGQAACRVACPAHVKTQAFVTMLSNNQYDEALKVVRDAMPFAGVLGRVCTSPCEAVCERRDVDEGISIRNLHRFLADNERAESLPKVKKLEIDKEEKVAVIGAGPAGLACAYDLVKLGYPVTVFEAREEPGGLLRWGIPEYRLPRDILSEEIERIDALGVKISVGRKIKTIKYLKKRNFKAIFLAIGASESTKLRVEGEDAEGIFHALDFLDKINSGEEIVLGKKVAIIGGGNAAIDAARVAKRIGAKKVIVVYRRSKVEMPAIPSEVDEAEKEGIKFHFLATPVGFITDENAVKSITCIKMRLGEPDASGRRRPIPIKGSEFKLNVDNVIIAVGQTVPPTNLMKEFEVTKWGTPVVDPITFQTSIPEVFAGGDVVTGPAAAVDAVGAGRAAAISIDRFIRGVDLAEGRPEHIIEVSSEDVKKEGIRKAPRAVMPTIGIRARAKGFDEVEKGFKERMAVGEAARCLNCAVCCECELCVPACKPDAIDHSLEDEIIELNVGTMIVATGFDIYDPSETREYGYGTFPNVITNAQLERMTNAAGPTHGKVKRPSDHEPPKSVAFVQCVGSRDRRVDHDYCCYTGCENSFKQATQIKEKYPDTEVTIFAMDIRTHGLGYEGLYKRARELGVLVVKGRPSEIEEVPDTKDLKVLAEDLYTAERLETTFDMVVLATALLPNYDTNDLARMLNISTGEYGFLMEAHPKLRPVDAFRDGIFLAGACLGPMDIPKAVAYGKAAAAGAQALMAPGEFQVEPIYAEIDTAECIDCGLCDEFCPYGAITGTGDERKVMFELCQGCGTCAAGCPQMAIDLLHYRTEQIIPQIEAASRVKGGVT